jgi:hypothetical protein
MHGTMLFALGGAVESLFVIKKLETEDPTVVIHRNAPISILKDSKFRERQGYKKYFQADILNA